MAGVVGRIQGQILGKATTRTPYHVLTVTSQAAVSAPRQFVVLSSSCLAQYNVGDTVNVYVAWDVDDITAIEAAVSVIDLMGAV